MVNVKEQLLIKKLLKEVVDSSEEVEAIKDQNPQIVAMQSRARAERKLAEAVIAALGGDLVLLKIYANGN
jgi:small-conductance mechanosensitive channel